MMQALLVFGCAVCFGDRANTALESGALAGILVLLGFIGTVLGGIVTVTLFWMRRARTLEKAEASLAPTG